MTTKTPKTKIHSIWFIILSIIGGNLCMGCAYSVFVLPHNIVSGGSGGMGVVLRGMFGIDPTIFVTVMMWFMFFLGLIFLGKSFSLKTLPSTFLYPASVYLFNCIKPLQAWTLTLDNTLLAAIFAGALYGIGSALIFKTGGSSGGTDIPALIVEKYTGLPFEKLIFAEDVIIIGAGVFFVGFEPALIGIILCFISMETIDRIMFGGSTCMLIFIMTNQLDLVNDYILKELNRGTTIVPCIGGYTKKPRQMIQAVVSRNEYNLVLHYVHEVDPKAFITIVNAKETLGEGFKEPGFRRLKGK